MHSTSSKHYDFREFPTNYPELESWHLSLTIQQILRQHLHGRICIWTTWEAFGCQYRRAGAHWYTYQERSIWWYLGVLCTSTLRTLLIGVLTRCQLATGFFGVVVAWVQSFFKIWCKNLIDKFLHCYLIWPIGWGAQKFEFDISFGYCLLWPGLLPDKFSIFWSTESFHHGFSPLQ